MEMSAMPSGRGYPEVLAGRLEGFMACRDVTSSTPGHSS